MQETSYYILIDIFFHLIRQLAIPSYLDTLCIPMHLNEYERFIIDNIRKYRKIQNLTQEALASRCGMTTSYIGLIESYKKFPKVRNLKRIADGLGIDISYLVSPDADQQAQKVYEKLSEMQKVTQEIAETFLKTRDDG